MSDSHANPFVPLAESSRSRVIWKPSRSLYESLRILHIAITVVAAHLLMMSFQASSSDPLSDRFAALVRIAIVVAATSYILIRELRAYWSEDAARERSVICVHAACPILATLLAAAFVFSGNEAASVWSILFFVVSAGWYVSAVIRRSILRQRLQFAVAQSGDSKSTSLAAPVAPEDSLPGTWGTVTDCARESAVGAEGRAGLLLVWLRHCLLTRRGVAVMMAASALMIGGYLVADYLIPVEVARCELGCDGDFFVASLHKKRGALYARCVDSQQRQAVDGSWRQEKIVREIYVGSSTEVILGDPSIECGVSPYAFTYHVGNRMVAEYDGTSRQFTVIR
ncbi:MAG: hypothetical protein JNM43_16510 [Planctomycetaceae bacterium]|nr:hypothetical protein [Planctomycetaceae bacterium]